MLDSIEADPHILDAAIKLFTSRGYHAVEMADIATEAGVALLAVQSHFPDKAALFEALLQTHNPAISLGTALRRINSSDARVMIQESIQAIIDVFDEHKPFIPLVAIDLQINDGAFLQQMMGDVAGESAGFINRLSTMPDVRPLSSIMLARTYASLIVGYIATQYLAPQSTQFALRSYPKKVWIEGMTDIFLNGILK